MGIIRVTEAPFRSLWECLLQENNFDPRQLAQQCAQDGGYDFNGTGLSTSDVENLFVGGYSGDVDNLAFFISEVLAYYHALAPDLTSLQLVSFAMNSALAVYLSKSGHVDWDAKIGDVLHVLWEVRCRINAAALVQLINCIFQANLVCNNK